MKKVINIIILIIWLIVIFLFSQQKGNESDKTSGIFNTVINTIFKDEGTRDKAKLFVRKCAHFTEYFILALLIINVLKDYKDINYKYLLLTIVMCMLYAASDEWHQTFVYGRVGCVTDVLIDTCGSILGVIFYKLFKRIKRVK